MWSCWDEIGLLFEPGTSYSFLSLVKCKYGAIEESWDAELWKSHMAWGCSEAFWGVECACPKSGREHLGVGVWAFSKSSWWWSEAEDQQACPHLESYLLQSAQVQCQKFHPNGINHALSHSPVFLVQLSGPNRLLCSGHWFGLPNGELALGDVFSGVAKWSGIFKVSYLPQCKR